MEDFTLLGLLSRINLVLASATVIIAFSLFVYLLVHNFRNTVARAFCALLAFVGIVYTGDVFLAAVDDVHAAHIWLTVQWVGIAFVPAAYLHFSDTILRTTNDVSRRRRLAVSVAFLASLAMLILVMATDWLVHTVEVAPRGVFHFDAGRLFPPFVAYFFLVVGWAAWNVWSARQRCLTSTSRRRMSYLLVSVIAPLSVFPYLLISPVDAVSENPWLFWSLAAMASISIATMTVIMAYAVAFHGVLTPDRVVKRDLIRYLVQAPLLGTVVIGLTLLVPPTERILGLPRDTVVVLSIVVGIVVFQSLVQFTKPLVDLIIYQRDWSEVVWLRRLDERLLTSSDLRQLLENILTSLCDLLRIENGFILVMKDGKLVIDTHCGDRSIALTFLRERDLSSLLGQIAENEQYGDGDNNEEPGQSTHLTERFVHDDGFSLLPLRTPDGQATLGVLVLETEVELTYLTGEEHQVAITLLERAALALEDQRLQQTVFSVLKELTPQIEILQAQVRGAVPYAGSTALEAIEDDPIRSPDFSNWVKDALSHYWGGPKLTESPLMQLQIVRDALAEHDSNPARAMRYVLDRALEAIKPDGQRSLTANEWVLYNIVELKFRQGKRARDVARRLAMSESDLYRKQRVAIEEVARQLASMEKQERKT
ncbi:MAG: histidine kinase N-terminal 7TM domain-containing protein [Anaerolineae bacterium]